MNDWELCRRYLSRQQVSPLSSSCPLNMMDIETATCAGKLIVERILEEESDEALKMTIASVPASRYITDMTLEEMSRDWFMLMPKQKVAGPLFIKMDQAIMDKNITLKANFSVIFNRLETLILLRAFTDEGAIVGEISPLPYFPGHTNEDVKNAIGVRTDAAGSSWYYRCIPGL